MATKVPISASTSVDNAVDKPSTGVDKASIFVDKTRPGRRQASTGVDKVSSEGRPEPGSGGLVEHHVAFPCR